MKAPYLRLALGIAASACGGSGSGPVGPIQNPPVTAPGDYELAVASGGDARGYSLHVPSGWNGSSALPVLLVFHGVPRGDMRSLTGFDALADARGFAVVYPESRNQDWAVGCDACTNAARGGVDDVRFVEDLLDDLAASLPIDSRRVWAAGFSQGALLTHYLACEIPDRIAAFASVASTMIEQVVLGCVPTRKVPWLFVHGSDDPVLPAAGAQGVFARTISIQTTTSIWADFDECAVTPSVTTLADGGDGDRTIARLHDYDGCAAGSDVRWYEVLGGGHTWPRPPAAEDASFGLRTPDFSASQVIADFVTAFAL